MRKSILFCTAIILLAATCAGATVVVTAADMGNWTFDLSYSVSGEQYLVRAFALDITADHGATFTLVSDYLIGGSTAANPGYGIFPGTIQIIDGQVISEGNPVCDPARFPGKTLPGLGTYGITLEMGTMYVNPADAPLPSDSLCRIKIDPHGASSVDITIAQNAPRGGIVMENPDVIPAVQLIGTILVPEPATVLLLGLGGLILRKRS